MNRFRQHSEGSHTKLQSLLLSFLCASAVSHRAGDLRVRVRVLTRIGLITGDNGLGKSFLLDVMWWALTRRWPHDVNPALTSGYPARPITLKALLSDLGYREHNGAWRHPDRQAIFLGDFIDRGPKQLETVTIVRAMLEAGSVQSGLRWVSALDEPVRRRKFRLC